MKSDITQSLLKLDIADVLITSLPSKTLVVSDSIQCASESSSVSVRMLSAVPKRRLSLALRALAVLADDQAPFPSPTW